MSGFAPSLQPSPPSTLPLFRQVKGYKRFVLFSPKAWKSLYVFPKLHPSSRQSQVDWARWSDQEGDQESIFPEFQRLIDEGSAMQVTLGPGDMLYIPPFWFHHVCVPHEAPDGEEAATSMSVSTHTEVSRGKRTRALLCAIGPPHIATNPPPLHPSTLSVRRAQSVNVDILAASNSGDGDGAAEDRNPSSAASASEPASPPSAGVSK